MAQRRAELAAHLHGRVQGKRFRLTRRCVCPPDNMGWGCCCHQPVGIAEDPEGEYELVRVDG